MLRVYSQSYQDKKVIELIAKNPPIFLTFDDALKMAENAYYWFSDKLHGLSKNIQPVLVQSREDYMVSEWAIRSQLLIKDCEQNHKDTARLDKELGELYTELTGKVA